MRQNAPGAGPHAPRGWPAPGCRAAHSDLGTLFVGGALDWRGALPVLARERGRRVARRAPKGAVRASRHGVGERLGTSERREWQPLRRMGGTVDEELLYIGIGRLQTRAACRDMDMVLAQGEGHLRKERAAQHEAG